MLHTAQDGAYCKYLIDIKERCKHDLVSGFSTFNFGLAVYFKFIYIWCGKDYKQVWSYSKHLIVSKLQDFNSSTFVTVATMCLIFICIMNRTNNRNM